MPRIPNFRNPDDVHKEQAARLRDFLKRAGIELKHTHALEAIAAVHGAKDFHTLQHAARQDAKPNVPVFVVNTYGTGAFIDSTVCNEIGIAIAAFAQHVRMYADLLPDSRVIVAAVHGGVRTEGLYCFVDDEVMVTLLQGCVGEVEKHFEPLLPGVTELDQQAVSDFAYNVTATLATRKRHNWEARRTKILNSTAAQSLSEDPISHIFQYAIHAYAHVAVDSEIADATRSLLDRAKVFKAFQAKVTDGAICV